MRIWGRAYNEDGTYQWVQVTTDFNGNNDAVRITNLIQVLKLSRNESPFYANYGIPAQLSVIQQIFPDIYVAETQAQFAPFFTSLIISKLNSPTPTYQVNILTHSGAQLAFNVPV